MSNLAFVVAPIVGVVGGATLALRAQPNKSKLSEMLRSLKPLTESTSAALDEVGVLQNPNADACNTTFIPFLDILSIYLNSRENRRIANEERIERPGGIMLLTRIEKDHKKIKNMVLFSMLESTIGKLKSGWKPLYSHDLLWFYAEEQELINQLAPYWTESKRHIILSRL